MIEFVTEEPNEQTVEIQMKLELNNLGSATLSLKERGDWVDIIFISTKGNAIMAAISSKEQGSLPGINFERNGIKVV